MAVYTKVSCDQMKILLNKYEVGNFLSMSEIQEGVENSNFKITTDKDNFILTIYEKRVNEKDLPYFINLMEYLYFYFSYLIIQSHQYHWLTHHIHKNTLF